MGHPGLPLAPRHWQDLGYLIIYVTGRPDMQKQRVVAWLAQHNFPHGVVSFCDGLVHDPLRQKAIFLRNLMQEVGVRQGRGFHRGGVSPRRPPPRLPSALSDRPRPFPPYSAVPAPACLARSRARVWEGPSRAGGKTPGSRPMPLLPGKRRPPSTPGKGLAPGTWQRVNGSLSYSHVDLHNLMLAPLSHTLF